MSIVTKTGDQGMTGLLYNRRVSKCHARVEACGAVDELNAALGLARATSNSDFVQENLVIIQKTLVDLMGELATMNEDRERHQRDGYARVTSATTAGLEKLVIQIEAQNITYRGWATPGATVHSAALDVARTTCRRAERRVCALRAEDQLPNSEIVVYLNRLSDLLWLFARWAEKAAEPAAGA